MSTWRKSPQKKIIYKFGKLTSSTFQKALDDFCVILGFHFIDERVPKKGIFFNSRGTNVYEYFLNLILGEGKDFNERTHLVYSNTLLLSMFQLCKHIIVYI